MVLLTLVVCEVTYYNPQRKSHNSFANVGYLRGDKTLRGSRSIVLLTLVICKVTKPLDEVGQ